jgi:hypothetical protein
MIEALRGQIDWDRLVTESPGFVPVYSSPESEA